MLSDYERWCVNVLEGFVRGEFVGRRSGWDGGVWVLRKSFWVLGGGGGGERG